MIGSVKRCWHRFRLWNGSLIVCPVLGEVRLNPFWPYAAMKCEACDNAARWAEMDTRVAAEREARVNEIAEGVRRALGVKHG